MYRYLFFFLAVSLLFSCGGSDGSKETKISTSQDNSTNREDTTEDVVETTDTGTLVQGNWFHCLDIYDNGWTSRKTSISIGEGTISSSYTEFDGRECETGKELTGNNSTGSATLNFTIGTAFTTGAGLLGTSTGLLANPITLTQISEQGDEACYDTMSVQHNMLLFANFGNGVCENELASAPTEFRSLFLREPFEYFDMSASDLEGSWHRCWSGGSTWYKGSVITFSDGHWSSYSGDFSDPKCQAPFEGEEYERSGSYQVLSTAQLATGEWVLPVDITYDDGADTCYGIMSIQKDLLVMGYNTDEFECNIEDIGPYNREGDLNGNRQAMLDFGRPYQR